MTKLWLFRFLLAVAVLLACLMLCEWALRRYPKLLPQSYIDAAPLRRALRFEMNQRGILARTPIEGVPIPYQKVNTEIRLSAPSDIVLSGLLSTDRVPAREREQELRLVTGRYGLLNAHDPVSVDVLLIGDSYTYLGGIADPPGLQIQLARDGGLSILNLGVPSVGPTREAWMLTEIGLPRDPRAVLWFFFGTNDLDDEESFLKLTAKGSATYGDLVDKAIRPDFIIFDVLEHLVSIRAGAIGSPGRSSEKIPGFRLKADPRGREFWLLPARIRSLPKSREEWRRHPGWQVSKRVLGKVASRLRQRGIEFLVVYVPSKSQVLLPNLVPNAPLLLRTANFGAVPTLSVSPARFWKRALRNRGSLESLVRAFCSERGIDFLSLTPFLTAQAAAGTLGYWSADTHWNSTGQSAAVPALASWLRSALAEKSASREAQE